jgi:hypothetical protein
MNTIARRSAMEVDVPAADPLMSVIERAARDQNIDIDKLDRLLAMAERQRTQAAEQAFNAAMAAAQTEMEPVRSDSSNPQTRSRYASYAALDRAVRPIYTRHGFGLSFNTGEGAPADQIRVLCFASHNAGYTRMYHIDMPADGKGAKGGDVMTKTHATGSGVSYGMRYLFKMIFNLATDIDDDGNAAEYRAPQQHAKAPPAPPMASGPYKIDGRSHSYDTWADAYIARILAAASGNEIAQWDKANDVLLGELHAKAHPIYQRIEIAVEKRKADLGLGAKPAAKTPPVPTQTTPAHADDGVVWEENGERKATPDDIPLPEPTAREQMERMDARRK